MGNKQVSSLPSYDQACAKLTTEEFDQLKRKYAQFKGSNTGAVLNVQAFVKASKVTSPSVKKYIVSRFFHMIDTKKDNALDFEEYLCALTLFRVGNYDDRIKVLFAMYEPVKGCLTRDSVRQLLQDSLVFGVKEESEQGFLEERVSRERSLIEAMTDMALNQFCVAENKMELAEFTNFVKIEGSVQALLAFLNVLLEN